MNIDLTGRLAVVTGGSGQLGRAIVRALSACGADVAVHFHRNEERAVRLCGELAVGGRRAAAFQADLTLQAEVLRMRDRIAEALGVPSIIVNNAVVQYDWKSVLEQDVADYDSQYRSCVLQNVLMAKAFVPAMVKAGWGRVIAVNTECAMQCFPGQSAYVAGKRGMDGVLRVLAKEIGPHQVTVNQVAPGWMISEDVPDGASSYKDAVPMRRRGHAEDIANAVVWLASDLAGFITGAYIPVCGGNVMPGI